MHSDDFTIDSLLDDLDDVVSTNHGDSKYSNPKYAPHPPNGEKSQSQVYSTNPKSRFTVLPISPSSTSTGKGFDCSGYANHHRDDNYNRTANNTSMSLESGFDTRKKNDSFTNRYSNYDSPAYSGLRYGDSSSATSMAGNEKENDNDNSVDYLLSMLSHSPSASKETTPVKQTPVKAVYMMYPSESSLKESQKSLSTFGSSCSLSSNHVIENRYDSKSEKANSSDTRKTSSFRKEVTTTTTAICDDFDEEDDDCKSHSRSWRERSDRTKGSESPGGQGQSSFKRVPTMQKLEDMQSVGSSSSDHIYSGNNSRTESSSNAIRKDGRETSSFNGDNLSSSSYGSDFDSKMERTDSAVRSNYSVSRPGSSLKMMPTTSYQSSRDSDKDRSCRNDKISSSNTPTSITSYPTIGSGKGNESPKSGNKLPTATSASIAAPLFFSPSKSANNSSNSIKVNNLQSAPSMSSSSSSANKTRCTRIVLAGSSSARGVRSSVFSKCACDNLRCLSCNFKVHLFVGSSWSSGPSVDYMFFRNNTPNESKLSAQLVKSPDQCAYCCQCSWTNTATERILVQGASGDPQWTCAGH